MPRRVFCRRLAAVAAVHASGFYIEHCHPAFVEQQSIDELAAGLVAELTEGVGDSDMRTGLLKSAISCPVVEGPEEKCARAVARAHLATGAAITTHTSGSSRFEIAGGNIGMLLLDVLQSEGVDPNRVIVGHVDENVDIRNLERLCRRGAHVQFDVIGKHHWMLDETRADVIAGLVQKGHVRHVLLSMDRARKSELQSYGGQVRVPSHPLRAHAPRRRPLRSDDSRDHGHQCAAGADDPGSSRPAAGDPHGDLNHTARRPRRRLLSTTQV